MTYHIVWFLKFNSNRCKHRGNLFDYAFVTLLKDIASPLFIDLLLGAFITTIIPANLSEILIKYNWLSYIVAIVMVKKMLGKQILYIYLSTIIIGSIVFGIGLDYMFSGVNVKKNSSS